MNGLRRDYGDDDTQGSSSLLALAFPFLSLPCRVLFPVLVHPPTRLGTAAPHILTLFSRHSCSPCIIPATECTVTTNATACLSSIGVESVRSGCSASEKLSECAWSSVASRRGGAGNEATISRGVIQSTTEFRALPLRGDSWISIGNWRCALLCS